MLHELWRRYSHVDGCGLRASGTTGAGDTITWRKACSSAQPAAISCGRGMANLSNTGKC
ncbi:hypothetical protein [Achromobacter phage SE2]|nr:hypothetical protein [Achromobacter phage SE2]